MVYHDRLLIGPPLLDDLASSTIEHDIMRRVREWMAGGRVPPGLPADAPRATDRALVGHTGICPGRSSSILGQMCDRISQPNGLEIEMARTIDTRTVLMDGSPHPPAPTATAESSG
jgi:hypothetical protein